MSSSENQQISTETKQTLGINLKSQNSDLRSFPHPFYEGDYGLGCEPKALIELNMMYLSGAIRSKLKWYEKMKDETIRNKWIQEAKEQTSLTDKQINYVLDELEYYNSIRDKSIEMSPVDGVWQSDDLVPIHLKELLIDYVKSFENVPENEQDWHPGTNKQVLDLVHPSLFCYVYNLTRIINDNNHIINVDNAIEHIGHGQIINIDENALSSPNKRRKLSNYTKSNVYQWLPSEFNVSKDGKVKIESYINNLHPIENKQLYKIIEQIFEHFVPLFNKVLTDLINNKKKQNRISVDPYQWYVDENVSNDNDDDDDDDDEERRRHLVLPDVKEFQMPSSPTSNIDLCGRKLQVIVKLANIILTPDNPKYSGGVWHVEGMENEHIVATGIYYYYNSNITQSDLQFRTVVCEPNYEQNDNRGVRLVYGLVNEGPLNQTLGEVITQEDRSIAFPNIYQHRVAPFQLKDPSQPGQRKILVFFLVDPSIRILSTANVPPQQSHWLTDMVRAIPPFNKLPSIIVDKIMNYIDYPMSMKEAKEHREKLMAERKYFIAQNTELLFERPFSLCEH